MTILFTNTYPAQEVFGNNKGEYYDDMAIKNLYTLRGSITASKGDYMHPTDASYDLSYPESNVESTTDRFVNTEEAVSLRTDTPSTIHLPKKVYDETISKTGQFSISFWMAISEYNHPTEILTVSVNHMDKIKLKVSTDGYLQIYKYSDHILRPTLFGQTRYPLSFNNISPTAGGIDNGYIFVTLTADKTSTRIFYSRPGGKLYSNYFWFGLSDILPANADDAEIIFGSRDLIGVKSMDRLDDIILYDVMLTPEIVSDHFLVQSNFHPFRSYIIKSFDTKPLSVSRDDLEDGYGSGFIFLQVPYDNIQQNSFERWYMPIVDKTAESNKYRTRFMNAKTMKRISRWNAGTGNYYYQTADDDEGIKDLFYARHKSDPKYISRPSNEYVYKFHVVEYESDNYMLGINDNELYLQYPDYEDTNWKITGSFKTAVREDFIGAAEKRKIRIQNAAKTGHMAIYESSANDYLVEDKSAYEEFYIYRAKPIYNEVSSDYNYYDYYLSNLTGSGWVSAKGGTTDTESNGYVTLESQRFAWQFIYIKDDKNGKPLYVIRANNGVGARILYVNWIDGNLRYITQNISASEGDFPDEYLWNINVIE